MMIWLLFFILQKGTGYFAIGDTLKRNWGRNPLEKDYVPNCFKSYSDIHLPTCCTFF